MTKRFFSILVAGALIAAHLNGLQGGRNSPPLPELPQTFETLPEIYTLGHRSPQGLALNPETGAIWENEHGPLGGDEINILVPGRNYGWPLVTFGMDYDAVNCSFLV